MLMLVIMVMLVVVVVVVVVAIMGAMGCGLSRTSVDVSGRSRSPDHRLIRQLTRDRSMLPFAHWKASASRDAYLR
jgi:hypothetical protein